MLCPGERQVEVSSDPSCFTTLKVETESAFKVSDVRRGLYFLPGEEREEWKTWSGRGVPSTRGEEEGGTIRRATPC